MAGWGTQEWGFDEWAGETPIAITIGNDAPIVVRKDPLAGSVDVPENATVTIDIFDANNDLDASTLVIKVNSVVIFDWVNKFATGFAGTTSLISGTLRIEIINLNTWGYASTPVLNVYIEDSMGNIATDTWSFTTRSSALCYTGLNPLPVELQLIQPYTSFLNLEPVRKRFLNNVLNAYDVNGSNKAARAVYQLAYSTELSTIQNKYLVKNQPALDVVVCEKVNSIDLDAAMAGSKKDIQRAIQQFLSQQAFTTEYIVAFNDYLDSTLYSYRVSLIANLLLVAAAIEMQE